MTDKQTDRVKTKIKKIKAALKADKKKWGGYYDDSRGLRYLPPKLYIQISDFTGGLRYMNWFRKNFEDDSCFPEFLFEWAIILFKTGRLKEAEKKTFQTFCSNTYLFDKFFKKEIVPIDKWEWSNLEKAEYAQFSFEYRHTQENLTDFSDWLKAFIITEKFIEQSKKFIEINIKLKTESDNQTRSFLIQKANQIENEF